MSTTLFREHAITFAARLVQEEKVKTGFSHKSVPKQEVFASKKRLCYSLSYWWKRAPHQSITKLYGKPRDLVAEEQGEVVGGMAAKK